jgi:UDP-GlcNAc:undecaprenyl-phosphate/decaprenyl-phosphate GlcNAc-1-phosphate transferase
VSVAGSAIVGFAVAAAIATVATPIAIAIAHATDFYDHPREYRKHDAPTPFLGGAAVLLAFLVAAAVVGALSGRLLVAAACAVMLWAIGTVDDRVPVAPKWRVMVTMGAAVAVYAAGLGWMTEAGTTVNVFLTILWIVGLVNAFNLMDNMDGACGTVASVAAVGIGVVAAIRGQAGIAGSSLALAGACCAFLRLNLARPARVFLGDGGSMPVGFLVATLAMAVSRHSDAGNAGLLLGALLTGLPILDVTLVSLSRTRRGVSLLTGGRDHLTHRMLLVARSPRRVALALAAAQGGLAGLAVSSYQLGEAAVLGFGFGAFVLGVVAILVLDTAPWRPPGIAYGPQLSIDEAEAPSIGIESA